jgi:hypothetical protein
MLDTATKQLLLTMYDVPDPERPGRLIPGYDRDHAERTTRIVHLAARASGLPSKWLPGLEVTTLLHDLGRAGMDPELFGKIFGIAQEIGLPIRIRDLRAAYPQVTEEQAPAFFIARIAPALERHGVALTPSVRDHILMRMDFKGRLRQQLRLRQPELSSHGITLEPWMERVMLYYYYPQDMAGEQHDVRHMGMLLVACENFEAYNNRQRGKDYYGRRDEQLREVFSALSGFERNGLVSAQVMAALKGLTASGALDAIIRESRGLPPGEPLPAADIAFQRELAGASPP